MGKMQGMPYFPRFGYKKSHPEGWSYLERPTRLELATSTLARWRSTR